LKFLYLGSKYIKLTIKAPDYPAMYKSEIKIFVHNNKKEIEEILLFKIDVFRN